MMPFLSQLGQGAAQMGQNFLQNTGIMPLPDPSDPADQGASRNPQSGPKKGPGFVNMIRNGIAAGQQPPNGQRSYPQAMGPEGYPAPQPGQQNPGFSWKNAMMGMFQ